MAPEGQELLAALHLLVEHVNTYLIVGLLSTILPALELEFKEDLAIKLATLLAGQVPSEAKKDYTMNKLARMQQK